jgi:hypothetical protein
MTGLLPTKCLYIRSCIRGNALQFYYYMQAAAVSGWIGNLVESTPTNFQVVHRSVCWWLCVQYRHKANVKPSVVTMQKVFFNAGQSEVQRTTSLLNCDRRCRPLCSAQSGDSVCMSQYVPNTKSYAYKLRREETLPVSIKVNIPCDGSINAMAIKAINTS